MLVRQLALEWGKDGIRCNTVSPGPTYTPMTKTGYDDAERRAQSLFNLMPRAPVEVRRVPALGSAGIALFFNGPESFTPDDRYHIGEAPEVRNIFVGAGFNATLRDWARFGQMMLDGGRSPIGNRSIKGGY